MRRSRLVAIRLIAVIVFAASFFWAGFPLISLHAQSKEETSTVKVEASKTDTSKPEQFKPEQQQTKGSVSIGGKTIDYDAYAGTLVVHTKDWDDVPQNADPDPKNRAPEASMFYVAYFKSDTKSGNKSDTKSGDPGSPRPVTFFYNGGPGSSTVWLHMGAFGPKRVVTLDDSHTPAAPYSVVNNEYSLLDATDLVFVDAPGTGFSRLSGKDKEKAFYGIDQDA
jgi:carboxypeptidase C (cathepsin A)